MVIWSGLGFLVLVITVAVSCLMNFVLDSQFGEGYYSSHQWAAGVTVLIGGLISSMVGFVLKSRSDREVIDVKTGERLVINLSSHTFFFIPMHWAGIVAAIIGGVVAVYDVMT